MEIKQYVLPFRKWWWLIVACTLVATVSSYYVTRRQPPIYWTRATVMVGSAIDNPNPDGNQFWLTQQLASTYADIVKRDSVRAGTMEALGLTWLPEYSARVVPGAQLIELEVTDTSPVRAKAVADELVRQLVLLSPQNPNREDARRKAFVAGQLSDLETKIEATQGEIEKKQSDLANLFSARQIADTQTQIEALQQKLSTLQANYAALLSQTQAGALNSITVIEPAALPTVPVGPQKMATVLLAAVSGLALALGAAFLMEYLDDTVKNPDDVQSTLGLPTLGAVPHAAHGLDGDEHDLFVLQDGRSQATEAYRVLRTNLQYASVKHPVHALLVVSAAPGDGKSITAANLAAALAQAGKQVILVDTDLHRPRLHKLFKIRNAVGVTTALLEEDLALDSVLHETSVPGLRVLPSGPLPPNPAELLDSEKMQDLLKQLKAQADVVVLDSPPIVALADAAILSARCDGVLMVLSAGSTRRDEAKRALGALRQVGARVIGAVLNQMPMRRNGYFYYYHYGYGYEVRKGSGESRRWRPRRQASRIQHSIQSRSHPEGDPNDRRGRDEGGHATAENNGTGRKVRARWP